MNGQHLFRNRAFQSGLAQAALFAALLFPFAAHGGGVVSNATESSLNSALTGGGIVTFAVSGTINITATKNISTNTVLDASGYNVTINGQGNVQLFGVSSGANLKLVNLTLANGKAANGGAVSNNGTLEATYCIFTNNVAQGANGSPGGNGATNLNSNGVDGGSGWPGGTGLGGAIYNGGSASLTNCLLAANSAKGGLGGNGGRGGDSGYYRGGNGGSGGAGGTGLGGAVYSTNSLNAINCTFAGNQSGGGNGGVGGAGGSGGSQNGRTANGGLGGEGSGAGLYAQSSLNLNSCTFYGGAATGGNSATNGTGSNGWGNTGNTGASGLGGGVYSGGSGAVVNCTFSGNTATGGNGGGGGYGATWGGGKGGTGGAGLGGGLYNSSTVGLTNCTITTCAASAGAPGLGGSGQTGSGSGGSSGTAYGANIANGGTSFVLKNSIIAYEQTDVDSYGATTDAGNNVCSDTSITLSSPSSYSNTNPQLSALAANGGVTPTCAIAANSVARDHGDDSAAPIVDQRDYLRSGTSDIGAYEYGGVARDYTTVELFATNIVAVEGSSVSAFIIYRDTYSGSTPAKTVYYTIGGTASNGVDYVVITNSCVIPAGNYAVTNVITPIYNATLDGTKTVTLTLLTNITYGVGTYSNATIGLLDDVPTINVAAGSAYAYGTNWPGLFSITRSGGLGHSLTVNYAISGTASPGSAYTSLPTAVTLAANQAATNLLVWALTNPPAAQTVALTLTSNATYFLGANAQAVVTLLPASSATNSVPSPVGRYWRGSGSDPTYWSIVVPLNGETGTVYDNVSGNCSTLYPGLSSWTNNLLYHYNATNTLSQANATNRIAFNNPIVAFGARVGGTPMYLGQNYSLGVYAGDPLPTLPIVITAYARTNLAAVGAVTLYPPNLADTNSWNRYLTNGFQLTTNAYGLATTLSDSPSLTWGAQSLGAYVLTHSATSEATNYYYLVQAAGIPDPRTNAMVITASGGTAPSLLYTLEFAQRPPWRSVFIDQPHFDGSPLPPFYAGMTVTEMLTNTPPVTNTVSLTPAGCTNLDGSPELLRHPILDSFVANMGNDPVALANYVLNEIELSDAMDYNENGNVAEESINPGGVCRGALGTYLEKQGSPTEQCALLIYLLRQAGVPACYVFPPHNGMKILDARLSRMLKFQVRGGFSEAGNAYTTNSMIAVNYPWVAVYVGTNWVHLFPWLKDYEVIENLNLYDYTPTNYPSAYPWVRDYVYGATNLLSLAVNGDNTPRAIFPKFLAQTLLQNHPTVSVDDLGVRTVNRRHYYARWQDFPTPTWLTNTSTPIESLSASSITNVSPALTNIFDTLSVEVYSLADPTKDIQTGNLRLADLHNRQFYLTQSNSAPGMVQLSLVLSPYRTNVTSQDSFNTAYPSMLGRQVLSMTLDPYDDQLNVRFKLLRHRALPVSYGIDPALPFLELGAARQIVVERPLRKGDVAALCLCYGRVTRDMVNVHAQDLWQMQSLLRTNSLLTNSLSADLYQGTLMTLCGMQYYQRTSEFDALNRNLHKINTLSSWAMGLSKIGPNRDSSGNLANGAVDPVLPNVDMFFYEVAAVGNGTLRPDSGQTFQLAHQNFSLLTIADLSAEEHQALNDFYQQTNAVSTVRMLQLAQSRGYGIVPLNVNNYVAQGQTAYQGHALQSYDPGTWQQIVNAFQGSDADYVTAYMTPGPMTNSAYKGMAALVLGWSQWLALITPSGLNGAFAEPVQANSVSAPGLNNWLSSGGQTISVQVAPPSGLTLDPSQTANFDWQRTLSQAANGNYVFDPGTLAWNANVTDLMGASGQGTLNLDISHNFQITEERSFLSRLTDMGSQAFSRIADPVNNITGEFYVDETDLRLPGPTPLSLRRNYSSQNLADNQFGPGWKLSLMPYLSVGNGATNIYAADMDGAVLAYVRTATNASVWLPTPAANPQLNNNTTAGAGGLVNRLRDRLVQTVNGSVTNYTLYGADGSVRFFQAMSFNNGIINQTRPCLLQWTDNCGNYYTFAYGTDPLQPDFGQVRRIQSSNGNYLGFYFDIYGHIIEAYSGDGRRVLYDYDAFGDLVTVTLPDETTRDYVYQHGTQAVTNGALVTQQPYSTHLITEEDKPDGRALVNQYDSQRRVTNQLSTAGADLTPVRTATFIYANNFNLTNSYTNTISGYTVMIDGNGNTNRYDYTNGLITLVKDPLNQAIAQTWYPDNATAPGYPRSVSQRTDKRGLVTQFFYDSNGNVTNSVVTGDLTGDGIASQTATNSAVYNTNCLPLQTVDPAGNGTVFVYDPEFVFLPQQIIRYAGPTPVSTTFVTYGSVTNVFTQGAAPQTNLARGLALRTVRAYGSSDAATTDVAYDGHGFPIQTVNYTGTSDPAVTNSFFYNERGQPVDTVDGAGALTHREWDPMDRPTEQWHIDETGALLAWSFSYYNDNGELTWTDGPAYNPEDYVWRDYDGAGRQATEIHWRAEARPDGTGVQAPAGDNLYAQTFFEHDVVGNLTRTIDPRGVIATNTWNPLNRRARTSVIETNGALLATESWSYEPGGLEHFHTNALGGFTQTEYTTAGLPKYRLNPDGSTNGWRYYLDGRLRREYQRNGAYWETTYDDPNRKSTRVFYNSASAPLATNVIVVDRRGNVIQQIDAAFNVFSHSFDGLDRPKVSAGPATVTVTEDCGMTLPGCGVYVTNTLRQVTTRTYGVANRTVTISNALGEKTVTTGDMLGRPLSEQTYAAGASTPLRVTTRTYSADHHSVTVTQGSGADAITTTSFTDNDGHQLLAVGYPATGAREFALSQFDLAGNLIHEEHDSATNNAVTPWTKTDYALDGMNRVVWKSDRDGAVTTFAWDGANNPTNRVMPGGLRWSATYNASGQPLRDWVSGTDGSHTQSNSYSYYATGSPFAGLLLTKTDGRGATSTCTYDEWLRLINTDRVQNDPTASLTTTWRFDVRGLATNVTEVSLGLDNSPATNIVLRSFDAYGQMASETILSGGVTVSAASQGWDVAGRRTLLALGAQASSLDYSFGWRADGLLGSVGTSAGSAIYGYSSAGLLDTRQVANRATTVASRDGAGRPLAITTTANSEQKVAEALTWTGDGLLATHVLNEENFTDVRGYTYATLSRRLTQERLTISNGTYWTNNLDYDGGASGGIGLLTRASATADGAPARTSTWTAGVSPLLRVNAETNTVIRKTAYGRLNGRATVYACLDGRPIGVNLNTTADYSWTNRWSAIMELTPGTHQLDLVALHPSGFWATNATVCFSNSAAPQPASIYRDGAGNITTRQWNKPNGTAARIQTLAWDAKGRLYEVRDYDSLADGVNGFYWFATYDGLDRLLYTTCYVMTNGATWQVQVGQTNSFVYDPQVEFLDLGVFIGASAKDGMPGQMTWKLCGPDLNGRYGGMNGAGGLEAVATGLGYFSPTINDARGNVLGTCNPSTGTVTWNPSRPTGYGAIPAHRPVPLGHGGGGGYAQSAAWRGKWTDITGYIWLGARFYDPAAGMWLSPDPAWNERDPSYWSFCGGDPINAFDPSGRCLEAAGDYLYQNGIYGENYRGASQVLAAYANSTSSPRLGAGADFLSSIMGMAAANASPASYVNQAGADYNAQGGGALGVLGALNRYNPTKPFYDVSSGIDMINGQQLSGVDRTAAGLNAFGTALLVGTSFARPGAAAPPGDVPPVITADAGGMANLHYYSPESLGQEAPHFSVETLGEGGMHTHQVITGPTATTMVRAEGLPSPTATIPLPLANPAAALALQAQRLGAQLGPYNMRNNSCLTTAADILRAGGADIPVNNLQLRIWVRGQLQ